MFALRTRILVIMGASTLAAGGCVAYQRLLGRIEQLRWDVADFGDRREILGHEIASRAHGNGRRLRSVDD